jgi:hypothetical protein
MLDMATIGARRRMSGTLAPLLPSSEAQPGWNGTASQEEISAAFRHSALSGPFPSQPLPKVILQVHAS